MRRLRFSTLILSLVLAVLVISSAILLTSMYYGVGKALQYDIRQVYQHDQHLINTWMEGQFDNIQQISQGVTNRHELHQGLLSNDPGRISQVLNSFLADSSGRYIDALVVEDDKGRSIISSNVSLLGVQLPLKQISQSYTSLATWNSMITEGDNKHYNLLHLVLPIIGEEFGKVIGKLHTFVLLNDNFWILNQLQELFGSQAISLSSGDLILDGLERRPGQLQRLRSAVFPIAQSIFTTEDNSTLRSHYLRIGNSNEYGIHSSLSNNMQLILKDAYTANLYYATALVIMLAIAVMLVIHSLITRALHQVTQYAEQVPQNGSPSPFKGGRFHEFIRVGNAVEKMLLRIRDRDKHLSSIIDNSPSLIFIRDLNDHFQLVNKRFAEVLGVTPERLMSNPEPEILRNDFLVKLCEADQRVQHSRRPIQYKMAIETSKGLCTFLVSKFPILDDQNKLCSIGSIATDISDVKQAEDALQLAHQALAETAEAIIVIDDKQNILSSNKAFAEMSGFDEGDRAVAIRAFLMDHPDILQQLKHSFRWQGEGALKCFNGSSLPVLVSMTRLSIEEGENRYVILFNNITKLKIVEQRLEQLALYDGLTGLPNRSLFKQRMDEVFNSGELLNTAVLFIDLDHFKNINDTYGHSAGDRLLSQVADRLRTCVQAKDTVARLGGDEFTVILREVGKRDQVKIIAQRILSALSKPYFVDSIQCFCSASIGIAQGAKGCEGSDILIGNADQAMYQAKKKGRDLIQFFDAEINARDQRIYQYGKDLRRALNNDELFIQYQPRFDIDGQTVLGAEALLRWRHPEFGLIPPDEFIPIAENSNLIIEIGRFVLCEACKQAAKWNAEGYQISISVNLSPRQLSSCDFVLDLNIALNYAGLSAHLLELEITETHVMGNLKQVLPILNQIKTMGVKLSIDDFGTGHSSLIYLKRLPIDILKIDRSFIMDIPGDTDGENLVCAIIQMAHTLRMGVVAEGIETKEQQNFLRAHGCDELQGFLLGKPGSIEQLKELASYHRSSGNGYEGKKKLRVIEPY